LQKQQQNENAVLFNGEFLVLTGGWSNSFSRFTFQMTDNKVSLFFLLVVC